MNSNDFEQSGGWSWEAFLIGPFWYLKNGLNKKGFLLLTISVFSIGLAIPFIWIYCGVKAKSDLYEQTLSNKSKFDINKL